MNAPAAAPADQSNAPAWVRHRALRQWVSEIARLTKPAQNEALGEAALARHITVVKEDDITGEPAQETVRFSLRNRHYEVDLTRANAERLEDALRPFIAAGRRVVAQPGVWSPGVSSRPTPALPREQMTCVRLPPGPATVRAWAAAKGLPVPAKGKLPTALVEQWEAEHPLEASTPRTASSR